MKNTQASTSPTSTATVRSKTTVSTKVPSRMVRYCRLKWRSRANSCHSPMFQATNSRMPASAASGTCTASGAASSTTTSSVSACTMPATGRGGAGAHVGDGARDRAGGRNAAEEGRDEVGHALGHQLLVRVVARELGGVVGHARAQQRLDRAEQGDGDRRDQQLLDRGPGELRQREGRQRLRNAAEARADGLHRQAAAGSDRSVARHQRDDRCPAGARSARFELAPTGPCGAVRHGVGLGPQHHQRQAGQADGQRRRVDAGQVLPQRLDLREEVGRASCRSSGPAGPSPATARSAPRCRW